MDQLDTECTQVATEVDAQSSADVHRVSATEIPNADEATVVVKAENETTSNSEALTVEVASVDSVQQENVCTNNVDDDSGENKEENTISDVQEAIKYEITIAETKDNNNENDCSEMGAEANETYNLKLEESDCSLNISNEEYGNADVQSSIKDTVSAGIETSVCIEASIEGDGSEEPIIKKEMDKKQFLEKSNTEVEETDDPCSSIVTEAELTNLVNENSEVVVEIVETVPITCESTEENIIIMKEENNVIVAGNENVISATDGKIINNSEIEAKELDIIDYSQQRDETVIEVSTEVVQSDRLETSVEDDAKETKQDSTSEKHVTEASANVTPTNTEVTTNNTYVVENLPKNISKKQTEQIEEANADITKDQSLHHEVISEEAIQMEEVNVHVTVKEVHLSDHKTTAKQDHKKKEYNNTVNEEPVPSDTLHVPDTPVKKRSVIQDIFDDWGVENPEEDGQLPTKVQDSVEIELKSLLDDTKSSQKVTEETIIVVEQTLCCIDGDEPIPESIHHTTKVLEELPSRKVFKPLTGQTDTQNKNKLPRESITPASKDPLSLEKTSRNNAQESVAYNQTPHSHITVSKNRNRHLTSQIASPAEVTKVLKERLREKQKMVETPRGPDIFFVKKITQRLSSKLAGGPVSPIPALIPLPHPQPSTEPGEKRSGENNIAEPAKDSSADNKELLAILEGDVDPDWSNLKPPTLTDEAKTPANIAHNEHSKPPKLDPSVERDLALKQLLELPTAPVKKSLPKKKKTFKPAPSKNVKETNKKSIPVPETKKAVDKVDLVNETVETTISDESPVKEDSVVIVIPDAEKEKPSTPVVSDVRIDESRSGRKRKPTEKAREHEQNTSKRQKVYKGKVIPAKKLHPEPEIKQNVSHTDAVAEKVAVPPKPLPKETSKVETVVEEAKDAKEVKETAPAQVPNKTHTIETKAENSPLKRPKQSLTKKGSQPIAKRKMVVKKLLRQKMSKKLNASPKKSSAKIVAKSQQKRSSESSSGDVKPKKKIINEIDRLLQDEGVVNLLYDVEQPDKKRLVPITKSQAKVMDIQKVQRELNIRKKLVRNAVLRLRTSTGGVTKASPRSTRTTLHVDSQTEKKSTDQSKSPKSATEFIFPAKIRNAADASIIIRRHSSSSFSSASGSPRVSVDGPEKQSDSLKHEDGSHSLRSTKRRHSQDERTGLKKMKKKLISKVEEASEVMKTDDKEAIVVRANKKSELKKAEKNSKSVETASADESSGNSSSKVITRSNGTAATKMTPVKSKKAGKTKVVVTKPSESDHNEESSKEEDELSACLAEAATALSIVSATSRSGNEKVNRKHKVSATAAKALDADDHKPETEAQNQFSNKEINVRRHGYLVQLILTPSTSSKIKNALTLQVMQEFREALSILKKDDDCRVVLFTSTGTSFCEGLELSTIMQGAKEKRRQFAEELADGVKDFVKSLASFNKPIVAGVQGTAIGLGVTMLPLFDLVIASDKATFSTPYGKLGQIAEGAAICTLSHILGSTITSELLLGGRTLTASEALRAGLVTRVLWPDRFQVDLLPSLRAMSEQSAQSMEATKALLRHSLRKKLEAALESETYLLIQHWCSAECQVAMKAYMDGKVQ